MSEHVEHITIVGGGSAGWLFANVLMTMLNGPGKRTLRVSVIESPNVPTVGVGESTVTGFARLLRQLGIDESDFIARCNASFKCGGRFVNWNVDKSGRPLTFINPFNTGGFVGGVPTAYHYLKYGDAKGSNGYADAVLPTAQLIAQAKGPKPVDAPEYESPLPYTFHLNAKYFAEVLRDTAIQRGVQHILDDVQETELDENGFIAALRLKERGRVPVEFVVDCTGFRSLILQQVLGEPFIPYGKHLLCDRAIPLMIPYRNPDHVPPCTTATALSSGWVWNIPLYDRIGTGYVYSSQFLSDDQALDELLEHLGDQAPRDVEPKPIRMRIGRVRRPWVKNCVAAGLSAGFVEPLEATAIFTIETAARLLVAYFPKKDRSPELPKRFNEIMDKLFEEILQFIVMNYYTSNREDSAFWLAARNDIELPDQLRENLALWRHTLPGGHDVSSTMLFNQWDYLFILLGKGYFEGRAFHAHQRISRQDWVNYVRQMADAKKNLLSQLPSHRELLDALHARYQSGVMSDLSLSAGTHHVFYGRSDKPQA